MNFRVNTQSLLKLFILFILIFSNNSVAQVTGPFVDLEKITDNVYLFKGYWGNATVLTGSDGLLFVDSKNNVLVDTMLNEMAKVCDKPLHYLINTHWHRDHVGGNEMMADEGAIIVSHENVLLRTATDQEITFFERKYSPLPDKARPAVTFDDRMDLSFNGQTIEMIHYTGHTDGDVTVFFKEENVLCAGDIYFEGLYPYIGISSGGSIKSMISAAKDILKLIDDETIVIPGHGPVSNKAMFAEYVAMLEDISNNIGRQIFQGISYEKIAASKPTKKYDEKWGVDFLGPDRFTELVYLDLSRK